MTRNKSTPGGGKRWITVIVVAVLLLGGWWVFTQWDQPPSTMPATGEAPVQNPTEGAPISKGNPPLGYEIEQQ